MRFHLRGELERSRQQHQGKSFLIVKDPVTRRYFRFTEAQATILELLIDPIDLETLAGEASARLGSTLTTATMQAFLDSLESKLLLDTPGVREKLGTGGKLERPGSSVLYWRALSLNPERVFDWLGPRTRWAFTPAFHTIGVVLIASGLLTLYQEWDALWASAPSLLNLRTLAVVWPTVLLVSTYHEFSHGLTCRHFGGRVSEVGVMLIYFSPAFYCDVSDSWMFPSKRNRMLVTFAGGYSQLILWGLCATLWRITDPSTFINHVLLVVVLFSGLQTLFNFNPLIKLDGYYMLSDYLEIPNLRAKAFKTLWDRVAGRAKDKPFREQRALVIYAIAALVFSTSLLVYVYVVIYRWTTTNWAFAGLIAFAGFAVLTLRRAAAEPVSGIKAMASRAALKKWRNLVILTAALVASFFLKWELKISAPFKVLPGNERIIPTEIDGTIVEILVQENARVRKGDVVARLSVPTETQRDISRISGDIEIKKRELDDLNAGATAQELLVQSNVIETLKAQRSNVRRNSEKRKQQQAVLARLDSELADAKANRDTLRRLLGEGLTSTESARKADTAVAVIEGMIREEKQVLNVITENEEREYDVLSRRIQEEESRLALMRSGPRPDRVKQLLSEISALQSQLDVLNTEVEKTDIEAPIDGVVSTPFPERKVAQRLEAGDEVLRLVERGELIAEISVAEKELAEVQMDAEVWLVPNTMGGDSVEGRVETIASVAHTEEGEQVVSVRSKLLADSEMLKPGTTGVAKIYCGKRPIIAIATRRLRLWLKTDLWPLLP